MPDVISCFDLCQRIGLNNKDVTTISPLNYILANRETIKNNTAWVSRFEKRGYNEILIYPMIFSCGKRLNVFFFRLFDRKCENKFGTFTGTGVHIDFSVVFTHNLIG